MKVFLLATYHHPSTSFAKRKQMEKQNLKKAHGTSIFQWLCCLVFTLSPFSSLLPVSAAENSITTTNSISKNQTIISAGGKFALGFFSPHNSTNSYLGIWYNTIPKLTLIWVANRASPIPKTSSAVFHLSQNGNLVLVLNETNEVVWTSNVTFNGFNSTSSTVSVLLDNGNLQLRNGDGGYLWQSFDHPSNTYVSEMKISSNRRTGQELRLTSWVNDEDPSLGIFSIGIDPNGHNQVYIWKGHEPYWRSNVYPTSYSYASSFVYLDRGFPAYISWVVEEDEVYFVSSMSTSSISTRFTLFPSGRIELLAWVKTRWTVLWQVPLAKCDFYSHCGPFTICQKNESIPLCKCLTGFQPKSHNEWIVGNWTGGCVRNKMLRCDKRDGFLKYEKMKLPDYAVIIGNGSVSDCEQKCFRNCSCTAYAYTNLTDVTIVVCLNWFRELVDIVNNYDIGHDLYVRVHNSKMVDESQEHSFTHTRIHLIAVACAIVSIGLLLISIIGYFRRRKRQVRKERINSELLGFDSMSTTSGDGHNNAELISFSLKTVLAATGSFSVKNKLGEGGFGPVYKGSLPGNREVAVKRLSKRSSQGREEFMNELKLIAKLQHTNLVRLLGCCVEEDEQILMYEYMPNRSLDQFLFDPSESVNLDWSKRFKIIEGIAQGLLYLHKYSRLRVIHRDLKASNVLLDQIMTPKISDFGLARIFTMNQIEDKTNRVVGTYGYMAPEYALHGRFSERSDVFSFGVLLLEIVTGKRNTSFHGTENSPTLSEWAWDSWMEGRALDLIDPIVRDAYNPQQAVKCINVGLLCVQEITNERPTMSEVVVMLLNETATIQSPKKPAFTIHRTSQMSSRCSNNDITVTNVEPR